MSPVDTYCRGSLGCASSRDVAHEMTLVIYFQVPDPARQPRMRYESTDMLSLERGLDDEAAKQPDLLKGSGEEKQLLLKMWGALGVTKVEVLNEVNVA